MTPSRSTGRRRTSSASPPTSCSTPSTPARPTSSVSHVHTLSCLHVTHRCRKLDQSLVIREPEGEVCMCNTAASEHQPGGNTNRDQMMADLRSNKQIRFHSYMCMRYSICCWGIFCRLIHTYPAYPETKTTCKIKLKLPSIDFLI